MSILKKTTRYLMVLALTLGLTGPMVARAATSPTLGGVDSYSVLAGSIITNTGATTMPGDMGISPSIGVAPHYTAFPPGIVGPPGTIHDADASAASAQSANTAAFGVLDQACTVTYAGTQDLTLVSPLGPGVYCADAFILTGNLTLTGSGVWIFKSASTVITSPGSSVTGGDPCNVWWRVVSSATLDTTTSFIGNILALTSITLNTGATLNGRALVQTGQVTLNGNIISGPTCSGTTPVSSASNRGNITVVKTVINDNGGTKTVRDFPLFVNGASVVSGIANIYRAPADVYKITETNSTNYTQSFSGDCDMNGGIGLIPGDNKFCIVTNNDIGAPLAIPPAPPLIDIVKVPNPLALPDGPGSVAYSYTLRNIGTTPVTDITLVGDTCSPISLVSGDVNSNATLEVDETWIYRCTTTLNETHTNTVVATGWANGLSTVDIASATVVVGEPIIPPLIHITKVPNPLTLPTEGGMITYTKTVTNPGTVALNNVRVTDDKCSPITYISGDTNSDSKLDPSETWTYTCQTNLTQTTINTAIATGEANGITVRDFAIATVVVAATASSTATPAVTEVQTTSSVPSLPNAGLASSENPFTSIILTGILFAIALFFSIEYRKKSL